MPRPTPPHTSARRKNRQQKQLLITASVLVVLAVGVGVALLAERPTPEATPAPQAVSEPPPAPAPAQTPTAPPAGPTLVEDNGRTLWASPTEGESLSLDWLPPGCEVVLHVRPAAWMAERQGQRTLQALGPRVALLVQHLEGVTTMPLARMESLLVGLRAAGQNRLEATVVVRPKEPLPRADSGVRPPPRYRVARVATHNGAEYRVSGAWGFFAPPALSGKCFIVTPEPAMREILDAGGAPPPVRRELRQLAASTDATRHVTLLATPSFLFTDGRDLLSGATAALREPIYQFLPDTVRAAALSFHAGDSFYIEARGVPAAEITATRLAGLLKKRMGEWPDALQLVLIGNPPPDYSRQLVARLPAMIRLLTQYTRTGVVEDAAVLNAYLPASAGPNLAAASELLATQLSAGAGAVADTTGATVTVSQGIRGKLAERASVSFTRDTLEMAVQYLSDEIGVPIVIQGGDLRLEGITKNQSFTMDAVDQPARDVLLEIVQKANPDRTATGPADPKQKLIYVLSADADGVQTIYITTRAAAEKRGDSVPRVFAPD